MLSAMTRRRLRKPLRYFRSKTQQNRYTITITSMNINWIILADIGDIAAKPKRIYQQQQRETTMDGRNCHSVVKNIPFFKNKNATQSRNISCCTFLHRTELNCMEQDDKELLAGLKEQFLQPPSYEVKYKYRNKQMQKYTNTKYRNVQI